MKSLSNYNGSDVKKIENMNEVNDDGEEAMKKDWNDSQFSGTELK